MGQRSHEPASSDARRVLVRRGYDSVSTRYRGDDECPEPYREWCDAVIERVRASARILDLGCGCGIPMARDLAAAGCDVVGVDLSDVQITRARALVPAASFVRADIARTGVEEQWLGGDAPTWSDQADRATYREWLVARGFDVVSEDFVPEGAGGHSLFWARG